ncbi:hypothetical protein [Exiguobacterium sp. s22]|uniref:hypothetical protein n=1 Tax=Exiguobacterium sp. s22 TaxID=2751272 RepID=UPI001BE6B3F6|nr:hypothetical protein [Exiguobacterium sp. s22]
MITVQTNIVVDEKLVERLLGANGYATDADTVKELASAYVDCKVAEYFDMSLIEPELLLQLAHDLDLLQAEMAETDAELRRDFGDAEIGGMR